MALPSHRRCLFLAACTGIFMFGIVLALLGTLFGLPEMRARVHINLVQQGDLLLLLFFGIFLATVVVGPMLDRFGNKLVLVLSSLLVTAALVEFSLAPSFLALSISSITLGLGGGGLNTSTNVLVSDLYGEDRGPMLNILGIFFGIGALFIPLMAASLSTIFTVGELLLFAAGLAGLCVAVYVFLSFPAAREAHSFSILEVAQVARYPGIFLFAFLLFFQSGNEASIGGWVSTFVGTLGSTGRAATWILAVYWAAMMLGRMLTARLLWRIEKERIVFISGLGSVAACLVLLVAQSVGAMAAAAALTGIAFAGIYPTTLAMVGDRYQRFVGTVFGMLFSIALIGGMVFPWAIGHLSQSFGVRAGMLLPVASTIMICILVAVITARSLGAISPRK